MDEQYFRLIVDSQLAKSQLERLLEPRANGERERKSLAQLERTVAAPAQRDCCLTRSLWARFFA
jgi:hypothetical protein